MNTIEPVPPGFRGCSNRLRPQVSAEGRGPTRLRCPTRRARRSGGMARGAVTCTPLRGTAPAEGYKLRGAGLPPGGASGGRDPGGRVRWVPRGGWPRLGQSCFPPLAPQPPAGAAAAAMSKEPRAGRDEILECQMMWEPDSKKNTQMDRFRAAVGAACGLALGECARRPPRASPCFPGLFTWLRGTAGRRGPPPGGRGAPLSRALLSEPLLVVGRASRCPVSLSWGVGRAAERGSLFRGRGASGCGVCPSCVRGVTSPLSGCWTPACSISLREGRPLPGRVPPLAWEALCTERSLAHEVPACEGRSCSLGSCAPA